ncbi:MAG: LamG-like jellyroll fold domain-containing protein [Planctomycetota bacterium]|jgi:hypothetical protein
MMDALRNNLVACILVCVVISLSVFNEASADVFDDANLVGFWQFSGDANDSSYFGNDGILYGDADAGYDILALDGTGDYVEVSDDDRLDITGDITISAWIYPEKGGAYQGIVAKCLNNGATNNPYAFRLQSSAIPVLALVRADATGSEGADSDQDISLNDWHHVAVRVDNNDVDFFVDGLVTGKRGTFTKTPTATSRPLYIGRRDDGLYFEGKIDDVMIYDAALNSWEIRQLYDVGNKAYVYSDEFVGDVFRGSNCTATGTKAVALGENTTASGEYSTAMGYLSKAIGDYSFAAGYDANAAGARSVAIGSGAQASGDYSTALGKNTRAKETSAVALGSLTIASGDCSIATGCTTTASGDYSTAMGTYSIASGLRATALGYDTEASGNASTATGSVTTASGTASTAMGLNTTAGGSCSFALGKYCINNNWNSFAVGFGSGIGNEQIDFKVSSGYVNVYGNLDVSQRITVDTLVLPVKGSDPASPIEGQIYVNILAKKVRVYAGGAWRDLATW